MDPHFITLQLSLPTRATLGRSSQLQKEQPLPILQGSDNNNYIMLCDFPETIWKHSALFGLVFFKKHIGSMWREADEWFLAEFSVYCSVTREFGRFFYLSSRGSGNPEPPKCFLPSSDSCMICAFFLVFGVFVIWFSERTFYHRKLQPHCFFGEYCVLHVSNH